MSGRVSHPSGMENHQKTSKNIENPRKTNLFGVNAVRVPKKQKKTKKTMSGRVFSLVSWWKTLPDIGFLGFFGFLGTLSGFCPKRLVFLRVFGVFW